MLLHPLRAALVVLFPYGGQHRARQNAWAGMSRDAALGRDRREAERALLVAARQAAGKARGTVLAAR